MIVSYTYYTYPCMLYWYNKKFPCHRTRITGSDD